MFDVKYSILKGRELGANISLLDVLYLKPMRDPATGKYGDDYIYIIYKDLYDNTSHFELIPNPTYTYYIAKEDAPPITYNKLYIDANDVRPVTCKYRDLKASIAKETGNAEWFYDNLKSGNYKENDRLFDLPNIFAADIQIEDYYRALFASLYKNDVYTPSKLFFDIEVNIENMPPDEDFPESGKYPIDAITLMDDNHKKVYTLLLEDDTNPQIQEFKNTPGLIDRLKAFVIDHIGGPRKAVKLGLDNLDFKIIFFKDELELLKAFWGLIHAIKPNIATAWNLPFDLTQIGDRILNLGENPAQIMSHPDFPLKMYYYYIDRRAKRAEQRGDFVKIPGYTTFIDQLVTFASRRKGQRLVKNNKLDTIGEIIAGVKKVDYSAITHDLSKLARINYMLYVFYNICDVLVQAAIEHRAGDLDFIVAKSLTTNTRYSKVHRQTVYLPNRGRSDFANDNYVMGDNINRHNYNAKEEYPDEDDEDEEGFTGAIVLDPLNVSDKPKLKLNGKPIMVCDNCVDYD